MIYSGQHSLALSRLYSETFGQAIPLDVARSAARDGRMQEMMAAVDEATRTRQPITDWARFEHASPESSAPIQAAV